MRADAVVSAMWRRCSTPTSTPTLVERSLAASTLRFDVARHPASRVSARCRARSPATCWSSAAATPGCGPHCMPPQRNPDQRIVLIEANRIGWAASGRNGGFVDASLTHGAENGKTRWPNEIDTARRDGHGESRRHAGRDRTARPRRRMAAHRHAVGRHRTASGRLAATRPRPEGEGSCSTPQRGPRARCIRRPTSPGCSAPTRARSCTRPSWRSNWPAPAPEAGVQIYEHTNAKRLDSGGAALRVDTGGADHHRRQVVLATNVFPSLLRRNRLHTVPVYDYVLATEPLTDAQLDRIGWRGRQGIGDSANQFHYYRLTDGQPDRVGRLRRRLPLRPQGRRRLRGPARHLSRGSPRTSSSPSRNSTTSGSATAGRAPSTPTPGSVRTGGWPATAGSPTSTGSPGSASARRGSPPTCASTCSTGKPTPRTELEMVRKRPLPFPPEPLASIGIQATRWSLDRADHSAGRRNILLRTLDALGSGSTPESPTANDGIRCSPDRFDLQRAERHADDPGSVSSASSIARKGETTWETDFSRARSSNGANR